MRLLKKKPPAMASIHHPASEALVKIKSHLHQWGRQLAGRLSQGEARMSRDSKVLIITTFCLSMSVFSMTLLYRGLHGNNRAPGGFSNRPAISQPSTPQLSDAVLDSIQRVRTARRNQLAPSPDSLTK